MLLTEGRWSGRGRYLFHGQSLGIGLQSHFQISNDEHGLHVEGTLVAEQQSSREFAVRVLPDDTGLYEITAQGFGTALQGIAKLSSEPNMGMLWAETPDRHVSFSIFAIADGYGCRGFVRDESGLATWELSMRKGPRRRPVGKAGPNSNAIGNPKSNVVSLPSRSRKG